MQIKGRLLAMHSICLRFNAVTQTCEDIIIQYCRISMGFFHHDSCNEDIMVV